MTSNNFIATEEYIGQLLESCLAEPGNFFSKLHRTDGITQDSPIEQLYANFYLPEQYEFITSTPHEAELEALNNYFLQKKGAFICHMEQSHVEPLEELNSGFNQLPGCDFHKNCIGTVLEMFHTAIQDYSTTFRLSILACDDNSAEICPKIHAAYTNFVNFVIIMENGLPALSEIISRIGSAGFPFSLWKFLHHEFVNTVLTPILPQVVEGVTAEIRKCRREAIEQSANKNKNADCFFGEFDKVFDLRAIIGMLASATIDEKSVHFLESTANTNGGLYETLQQKLNEQTEELYGEYAKKLIITMEWKKIIRRDIHVLDRTLVPSLLKNTMDQCVKVAKRHWTIDEGVMEKQFAPQQIRDAEVEIYAKRIGIMA